MDFGFVFNRPKSYRNTLCLSCIIYEVPICNTVLTIMIHTLYPIAKNVFKNASTAIYNSACDLTPEHFANVLCGKYGIRPKNRSKKFPRIKFTKWQHGTKCVHPKRFRPNKFSSQKVPKLTPGPKSFRPKGFQN